MPSDIAIKVDNVSKTFILPHDKATSLKHRVVNTFRKKRGYEVQQALQNISFEVKKGEFFGIVGKNGGGKSTLLKIISGIYTPSQGSVQVNGKLTPFIELGVGFNPELTGRENVFLNGALLGFNRKEMLMMYDDIVEFAELEKFMDQKLKNYSSGMQVRLAFSIAIRADSEILVMDEVLAVGDAAFQKKCFDVFREIKKQGRTIILVTHDMGNVERFCDRALIVNEGKQLDITTPSNAASIYARLNIKDTMSTHSTRKTSENRYGSGQITVEEVSTVLEGKKNSVFNKGDEFSLVIDLKRDPEYKNVPISVGLAFFNEDGINVSGPNTEQTKIGDDTKQITYTLPKLALNPGEYSVTVAIYSHDNPETYYDFLDRLTRFSVISDRVTHGIVDLSGSWSSK